MMDDEDCCFLMRLSENDVHDDADDHHRSL